MPAAMPRRVFRARLRNPGRAAAVVLLDVALPAPFLPNAAVLMRQPHTIAADATLRVDLGSTVGMHPGVDGFWRAISFRVG